MDIATLRRALTALHQRDLIDDHTLSLVETVEELTDLPPGDLATLEDATAEAFDEVVPEGDDGLERTDLDLGSVAASAVAAVRDARQQQRSEVAALAASVRGPDDPEPEPERTTRPSLAAANAHRRAGSRPRPRSVNVQALTASGERTDGPGIARAFLDEARGLVASAGSFRRTVATVRLGLPDDRMLGEDPTVNADRIDAAVGPDALTAAGGLCAPVDAHYDVHTIAGEHRPIRSSLPTFGAERGGIRLLRAPTLSDVADGVGVWTAENDAASSPDPETKPVHRLDCGDEVEVLVSAITKRMQAGNFNARTHPEAVHAALRMLTAQHARIGEGELFDEMVAASTAVTADQTLGAARDLLTTLDRAAASYRSRNRIPTSAMLRVVLPEWTRNALRADLAMQLAGDASLALTDEQVDDLLTARSIVPAWSPDVDPFGVQNPGALAGWPTDVTFLLFAEGTFLFLDGGTLDLGIVRDTSLNEVNDVEWFAENFENVARVGTESLALTATVDVNGTAAGTVDTSPTV